MAAIDEHEPVVVPAHAGLYLAHIARWYCLYRSPRTRGVVSWYWAFTEVLNE